MIETLISLAIFASSITGLIAITSGGISNANFVKNKFTASYLALEGQELVHNLRDTSTNSGGNWTDYFNQCTDTGGTQQACTIDPWVDGPLAVDQCPDIDSCRPLTYQNSTGQFSYHTIGGGDYFSSIFTRTITVRNVSPTELQVVSKVEWLQGTTKHNVSYSSELLNWTAP